YAKILHNIHVFEIRDNLHKWIWNVTTKRFSTAWNKIQCAKRVFDYIRKEEEWII
ncbi:hypothetical protein KI387_004960, partial [Taxus chinensis]